MSKYDYCKTCIDGRECVAYSKISGCDWRNSPEKCKAHDKKIEAELNDNKTRP